MCFSCAQITKYEEHLSTFWHLLRKIHRLDFQEAERRAFAAGVAEGLALAASKDAVVEEASEDAVVQEGSFVCARFL